MTARLGVRACAVRFEAQRMGWSVRRKADLTIADKHLKPLEDLKVVPGRWVHPVWRGDSGSPISRLGLPLGPVDIERNLASSLSMAEHSPA